jgi:hypothetical protein
MLRQGENDVWSSVRFAYVAVNMASIWINLSIYSI